jgi:hypothetical protein
VTNNGFDLDRFTALRDADIHTMKVETHASKRRAALDHKQFIKVPLSWVGQLRKTTHRATIFVALELLHSAWKNLGKPVTLSNTRMAEWGVTRSEKQRALAELEAVELVRVERSNGKAPRVTLLKV